MPLYSFKRRFVPYINDGTKTQTVRKIRKFPPREGQPVTLVTGSRFKPKKIGYNNSGAQVSRVDTVVIFPTSELFLIEDLTVTAIDLATFTDFFNKINELRKLPYAIELDAFNKDVFAWNDGFRNLEAPHDVTGCFDLMFSFWKQTHELPFIGHVTHWEYNDDLPF